MVLRLTAIYNEKEYTLCRKTNGTLSWEILDKESPVLTKTPIEFSTPASLQAFAMQNALKIKAAMNDLENENAGNFFIAWSDGNTYTNIDFAIMRYYVGGEMDGTVEFSTDIKKAYMYTEKNIAEARLEYLKQEFPDKVLELYEFDTEKHKFI